MLRPLHALPGGFMYKKLLCALALTSSPLFLTASTSPIAAPPPKPKVYTLPHSILDLRAPDYIETSEMGHDGSEIWVYSSSHSPLTFRIISEAFSTLCLVTHNKTGKKLSISIGRDCNLDWPEDAHKQLGLV